MYIGKDLLFPDTNDFVLKNTDTTQIINSPIRVNGKLEATASIQADKLDVTNIHATGTSQFDGLITGEITSARWS